MATDSETIIVPNTEELPSCNLMSAAIGDILNNKKHNRYNSKIVPVRNKLSNLP
jgi:hypothetical protein